MSEIDRGELLKTVERMPGYIAVYLVDESRLRILYYSPGIPGILGYTREEYDARTNTDACDTVFSGNLPEVRAHVVHCIEADGRDVYCDFYIPCRDHGYVKTRCVSRIVGTMDEKPVMICNYTNFLVQETPSALPGLTDAECKSLVDNIPAGIAVMRLREGRLELVAANPALSTIVGVTQKNIVGATPEEFYRRVHPDDLAITKGAMQAVFSERHGASCVYRALNEKNHKCIWLHAVAKSYDQPDGSQIAYINYTDVTAQKETEAELRESRQRYQLAVRGASLTVWEYDIHTRRSTCPDDGFNLAGFPSVIEDVPNSLLEHVDEKYRAQFLLMFADIASGKREGSCELWYRRNPSDKPRCTRTAYSTIFNGSGKPIGAYGVMQDITLQRVEAKKYSGLMQKLLHVSSSALCTVSLDLTTNRREKECDFFSGLSVLESLTTADDFLEAAAAHGAEEKDAAAFRSQFNRHALMAAYFTGQTEVSLTYQRKMEDGRSRWVEAQATMAQNPDTGNIEAVYCLFDRNEKVKGDRLIQRLTNEEYDFIGMIDISQRLFRTININTGELCVLEQLASFTEDELLRRTVTRTIAPEDQERYGQSVALDNVLDRLRTDSSYTFSFTYVRQNGERRRKQLRYCWLDDTREEILVLRTDVTAAYNRDKEQMRLLQAALRSTEKANEMRIECISNLGHDLRTPLNDIVGYTHLAGSAENEASVHEYLRKIESSAGQLQNIIGSMLDFSSLESGEAEFLPESIETALLIEEVAAGVHGAAEAKHIHVEIDDSQWHMPRIYADRASLLRILTSLLLNSIRFTAPGGRVRLTMESFAPVGDGANCRFKIHDNGYGISREFLPYVFEPFAQEERSEEPESANVSLDLAIVKRLVEMMNGAIWVESEKGRGTTFTLLFRFPEPLQEFSPPPA